MPSMTRKSKAVQVLPLGDDPVAMLWRILSFNVGVEVGQIAALSVMVAVLALWRNWVRGVCAPRSFLPRGLYHVQPFELSGWH